MKVQSSKLKAQKIKTILAIESTCDETSAAVGQLTDNGVVILSNIVASSATLQAKYGGVIPEQAAREQLKSIIPVIKEAISDSRLTTNNLDAIAVAQGPGLIGSLLVGVETAKTLALLWNKPLIPVNHLTAHFYANWIIDSKSLIGNGLSEKQKNINHDKRLTIYDAPTFPILGLLVSGGHTDLVMMKNHGDYEYLGGTRDDAAGEAFDKTARLLGLPYPGGPNLSKIALKGDPKAFNLPRPMLDSGDYDFSFSGLKTNIANIVYRLSEKQGKSINDRQLAIDDNQIPNLAASVQEAIVDTLIKKVVKAAKDYKIDQIMIAGGVAANLRLRQKLQESFHGKIFIPPVNLCTDNAAMTAACAFYNSKTIDPLILQANPNLAL